MGLLPETSLLITQLNTEQLRCCNIPHLTCVVHESDCEIPTGEKEENTPEVTKSGVLRLFNLCTCKDQVELLLPVS